MNTKNPLKYMQQRKNTENMLLGTSLHLNFTWKLLHYIHPKRSGGKMNTRANYKWIFYREIEGPCHTAHGPKLALVYCHSKSTRGTVTSTIRKCISDWSASYRKEWPWSMGPWRQGHNTRVVWRSWLNPVHGFAILARIDRVEYIVDASDRGRLTVNCKVYYIG